MSILEKLYLWNKDQFIHDIFDVYSSKSVFVNYLYFANVMHQRLLEHPQNEIQKKYAFALQKGDFLLVDGIALQWFYRFSIGKKSKIMPYSLNGTDLFSDILQYLAYVQKQGKKIHLAWYSLYDHKISKTEEEAKKAKQKVFNMYWLEVDFLYQSPYQEKGEDFDREWYTQSLWKQNYDIHVFCNFMGTPFQEIWWEKYRTFFEENHVLVLNQGGTIDFLSGFEVRAPRWIVKSRILETPWRILSSPKKNLKKFLWMFGILRYWLFLFQSIFWKKKIE